MSVVHIHFLYVRTFSHRIGSNTIFLSFFVCCYLLCLFIYLIYIFISHRTMHTTHRSTYNLHIEFHPFFSTYSELSTNSQQNWFHFAQTSTETRYIKPLLIYCLLIRLHSESFKVYFKHTHFLLWMHGRIDFTVVAVFYTCPKINQFLDKNRFYSMFSFHNIFLSSFKKNNDRQMAQRSLQFFDWEFSRDYIKSN